MVLLSDSVSAGTHQDVSGARACERLVAAGFDVTGPILLPDEPARLRQVMQEQCKSADLVLTAGGTGVSPRNATVDAMEDMLDRELPGLVDRACLRTAMGAACDVVARENWTVCERGLPQENVYVTILREGLGTNGLDPLGLYPGTTSGHLFASRDGAASWALLAGYLPGILSVRATIG